MNRQTESHKQYSETFLGKLTQRNWIVMMLSGIMALARLGNRGMIHKESLEQTSEELQSRFRS